ncbi:MAG: transglutaminase family protein [Pirellulales bacterium]
MQDLRQLARHSQNSVCSGFFACLPLFRPCKKHQRLQTGRIAWLLLLLLVTGCNPSAPPPAKPTAVPAAAPREQAVDKQESERRSSATPPNDQQSADGPVPAAILRQTWDAIYLQGQQVGYLQTTVRAVESTGRQLVRIDQETEQSLRRGQDVVKQRILLTSLETPDGQIVRCESQLLGGEQAQTCRVTVDNGQARLETTTAGKTTQEALKWPADVRGFLAIEQSLAEKPLEPGEIRTFKSFVPLLNQIGEMELTARDRETVDVAGNEMELLRVEIKTRLPDQELPTQISWIDRTGEQVKSKLDLLDYVTVRTTKEVALGQIEPGAVDINVSSMVRIKKPAKSPHGAQRAKYHIRLKRSDPAATFATGASQAIEPVDDRTADVTVMAIRPGQVLQKDPAPDAAETKGDTAPNNLIQSDDPAIVAMAQEAIGPLTDPWEQAAALTQYVHKAIQLKDYRSALATAAEVARTRSGDCTEHAVLLAALARASGLPARVAMGLVYVERESAFMFHMWTEIFVNDTWIPLDGTLGTAGIGCGHIKLLRSNLEGGNAYSSLLPVANVLGQIEIEVLEVE